MQGAEDSASTSPTVITPKATVVRIEQVEVLRHATHDRPASLDVSESLAPPINQGLCGSCWAISTTQVLRDRINRHRLGHRGPVPSLSLQFVMDCASTCIVYKGRRGCANECSGGFLVTAFEFLKLHGTPRETFHPNRHADSGDGLDHIDGVQRTSGVNACPRTLPCGEPLYRCDGYYNVHLYDTFGITNARAPPKHLSAEQLQTNAANIAEEIYLNGPVAVCYNLFSDFRDFWKHPDSAQMVYEVGWQVPLERRHAIDPVGDVRWTARNGPHGIHFKTGHSVSLVGYGEHVPTDGGPPVPYWICRNSWGRPANTYRGGYFKIRRGVNASAIEGDVGAPRVLAATALKMALPRYCSGSLAAAGSSAAAADRPTPARASPAPATCRRPAGGLAAWVAAVVADPGRCQALFMTAVLVLMWLALYLTRKSRESAFR